MSASQPSLFDVLPPAPKQRSRRRKPAAPFVRSSETSRAAAEAQSEERLNRQEAAVLAFLQESGPSSDMQIWAAMRCSQYAGSAVVPVGLESSFRRARVTLVEKGKVYAHDKEGEGATVNGRTLKVTRWAAEVTP